MSRIGKKPIPIPAGVKVDLKDAELCIEGPKGKLIYKIPGRIKIELSDNKVNVKSPLENRLDRSMHGLARSLVANMIKGVNEGYLKELEIQGVGFRASVQGNVLSLILGFSHPVNYNFPADIRLEVPKPTQIIIKGIDKQKVGEVAAQIRRIFPPEPYKGKGIRYVGEFVRRKLGKAVTK